MTKPKLVRQVRQKTSKNRSRANTTPATPATAELRCSQLLAAAFISQTFSLTAYRNGGTSSQSSGLISLAVAITTARANAMAAFTSPNAAQHHALTLHHDTTPAQIKGQIPTRKKREKIPNSKHNFSNYAKADLTTCKLVCKIKKTQLTKLFFPPPLSPHLRRYLALICPSSRSTSQHDLHSCIDLYTASVNTVSPRAPTSVRTAICTTTVHAVPCMLCIAPA